MAYLKKLDRFTFRLDEDCKKEMIAEATRRHISIGEYIRGMHAKETSRTHADNVQVFKPREATPEAPIYVFHVDDLGADGLRADTGALVR